LALLAAACAGEPFQPAPTPRYHVLFIGNSLTAVNDLPHTVSALAATVHDSIAVEAATGSNLAIIDHVNGATDAVDLIRMEGGTTLSCSKVPPASNWAATPLFWRAKCSSLW